MRRHRGFDANRTGYEGVSGQSVTETTAAEGDAAPPDRGHRAAGVVMGQAQVDTFPTTTGNACTHDPAENSVLRGDVTLSASVSVALGGEDADKVEMESLGFGGLGEVRLKDVPDYEAPGDEDGDNVYRFFIAVHNGFNSRPAPSGRWRGDDG